MSAPSLKSTLHKYAGLRLYVYKIQYVPTFLRILALALNLNFIMHVFGTKCD